MNICVFTLPKGKYACTHSNKRWISLYSFYEKVNISLLTLPKGEYLFTHCTKRWTSLYSLYQKINMSVLILQMGEYVCTCLPKSEYLCTYPMCEYVCTYPTKTQVQQSQWFCRQVIDTTRRSRWCAGNHRVLKIYI